MFDNPFSPTFGGRPDFFFGRKNILDRFDAALKNRGSADRALFVTGTRGCGKTALLEQLSRRACARGWRTIDINSENALETLARRLVRHDSSTRTVSPEVAVQIFGTGGSFGGISTSQTVSYDTSDIELMLLEACADAKKGLFVSIDEIQKIELEDLSVLCGAFQMALRKGHDVILAVAGLPYAHDEVIQYEGCTYMRRAVHERLGVFTHSEAASAFDEAFAGISGLSLGDQTIPLLVETSFGHPYVIQLAGYYLVERANQLASGNRYAISTGDVEAVLPDVMQAYKARSLDPILSALTGAQRHYLTAMAQVADPTSRISKTADIAKALGKEQSQTSTARQGLLRLGLVVTPGRGQLMFNIPYLRDHLLERREHNPEPSLALEWRF